MRALELGCDVVFKATKVDGVYSDDPVKNPKARKYDKISFEEAFRNNRIKIMDKAAVELCMRHGLKIVVFNVYKKGALKKALLGEKTGTVIE